MCSSDHLCLAILSLSISLSLAHRFLASRNNVKSLLGTDNLCWDVNKKEGAFANHAVYDGRRQDYDYGAIAPAAQPGVLSSVQRPGPPPQDAGARLDMTIATTQQPWQPPPPPQQQQSSAPRFGRRAGIDHKADALWAAVGARDQAEVEQLLRQGADPCMVCPDGWVRDECRPKDGSVGRSLLHHAAWAGDLPR